MKRPGVEAFIKKVCDLYEVAVYTASMENYGTVILDQIDHERLISYRLFRNCCSLIKGNLVKNLARLGRDLKDVVIVDNSPSCYTLQPCNGIPVKSWIDDKRDCELEKLADVLELLITVDDVRDYLRELVTDNKIDYDEAMKLLRGEIQIARPELEFRKESSAGYESPRRTQSMLTMPKIIEDPIEECRSSPKRSFIVGSFSNKELCCPENTKCQNNPEDSKAGDSTVFTILHITEQISIKDSSISDNPFCDYSGKTTSTSTPEIAITSHNSNLLHKDIYRASCFTRYYFL